MIWGTVSCVTCIKHCIHVRIQLLFVANRHCPYAEMNNSQNLLRLEAAATADGGSSGINRKFQVLDAIPKEKQKFSKIILWQFVAMQARLFCEYVFARVCVIHTVYVCEWCALLLFCNTFSCRRLRKFIEEKAGKDGGQHATFTHTRTHTCTYIYSHTFLSCRLKFWQQQQLR